MRLHAVSPREVPDLWPAVRDRIASCCARSGGRYEPVDVLHLLLASRMNLFCAVDEAAGIRAIALTEIVQYQRINVCKLLAGTGDDGDEMAELLPRLEDWARAQGCAVLEPICRPGWQKRFAPLGYKTTHVVMEKRL